MGLPRIVMTCLVRNEADIVADMITYHLARGVTHVIAMDNASTDGTTEILEDFATTGALTLIRQPSDDYLQDVWATEMARMARDRHAAEWIISNDADEFWMPENGSLADILSGFGPETNMVRCARRNLMAAREDLDAMPWHEALVWRADPEIELTEARKHDPAPLDPPFLYYGLPGKVVINPVRLLSVKRGAHSATFEDDGDKEVGTGKITIYHAPVRQRAKFVEANRRIGSAVERARCAPNTSWKSRRWHRMPPNEAYKEALPGAARLTHDVRIGAVRMDTRLRDAVRQTRCQTGARLALAGLDMSRETVRRDPLGPPVPVLVVGGSPEDRVAVASRLAAVGACRPPSSTGAGLQTRLARLHHARLSAIGDSTTARIVREEIRGHLERYGWGGHGAVISDIDLVPNLDLWRALAAAQDIAPAVILLSGGDRDARARAEAGTRSLPRMAATAHRILSAEPAALQGALARLGLWLPRHLRHATDPRVPHTSSHTIAKDTSDG